MKDSREYKREMGTRLIMEGCKVLGWQLAIPEVGDDEEVPGLICGTDEWMSIYTETKPAEGEIVIETETEEQAG